MKITTAGKGVITNGRSTRFTKGIEILKGGNFLLRHDCCRTLPVAIYAALKKICDTERNLNFCLHFRIISL